MKLLQRLALSSLTLAAAFVSYAVSRSALRQQPSQERPFFSKHDLRCTAWNTEQGIEVLGIVYLHNKLDEEFLGWALEVKGTTTLDVPDKDRLWRRQYFGQEFVVPRDTSMMPMFSEVVPMPPGLYSVKLIVYEFRTSPTEETWLAGAQTLLSQSCWVEVPANP